MSELVKKIHNMGLKLTLWFGTPFMGIKAKHLSQFADMVLYYCETLHAYVLDPRYPKVRQYLTDSFAQAVRDWDIDGVKLDFIDMFKNPTPAKPEMDYTDLTAAVEKLLSDIKTSLQSIKPNILIEFRQPYIGPIMRTFANIYRVTDCPDDSLSNRVGIIDLRLLSGNTVIQSDMLMWHKEDTLESSALQILSCIFSAVQISVCLDTISDRHLQQLTYWMAFMNEHRNLLLDTPIEVESPQNLYSLAHVEKNGQEIIVLYDGGHVVTLSETIEQVWAINATYCTQTVFVCNKPRHFQLCIVDCCGNKVSEQRIDLRNPVIVNIPACGMAYFYTV